MNKKLLQIMKRQSELAKKASGGALSDAETQELDQLNAAIEALTDTSVDVGKTSLTTMKLSEFKKHVESEQSSMDLDPKRLALLKRNIESVKSQGKSEDDDIVAVEVIAETEKSDERLDKIENKLNEIFDLIGKKFDGRTNTGVTGSSTEPTQTQDDGDKQDKEPDADVGKEDEADLVGKLETLKGKLGEKEFLSGKSIDDLVKWFGEQLDSLTDTAKADDGEEPEGDKEEPKEEPKEETKDEPKDEPEKEDDEGDGDEDEKSKSQKSVHRWKADLSPRITDADKQYQLMKSRSLK